jgi:hypothetical protein
MFRDRIWWLLYEFWGIRWSGNRVHTFD